MSREYQIREAFISSIKRKPSGLPRGYCLLHRSVEAR